MYTFSAWSLNFKASMEQSPPAIDDIGLVKPAPAVMEAPPVEPTPPVEATGTVWVRPIAGSGRHPSKKTLAESMGMAIETYNSLLSLGRKAIQDPANADILTSWTSGERVQWVSVDPSAKERCYNKLKELVKEHTKIVDHSNACGKIEDSGIQDHFIHAGWKRIRGYKKSK
ncbi:hypothetical protein L211DRAFT_672692 [Terfezia boudieri ATCC MYA-4762]|uniref:Uncharacterized protein n=1 Tax=Terfezia boudieri ATCC MYA-4762 TaxID=1051890 RepID=A0A3N4LLX8_9PEZI|nr:hypothetical protein L211DRAFT_672692 [Terfezia boudieri ATCC MYA-4762]